MVKRALHLLAGVPRRLRPRTEPGPDPRPGSQAARGPLPMRRVLAGYVAIAAFVGSSVALAGSVLAAPDATATGPTAGGTNGAAAVTVSGRGEQLFLTSCASCHGPQGQGGPGGPDIRQAGAALADFVLTTGRMPLADPTAPQLSGPPRFDAVDTKALVDYVASLGNGPAIPNVVVSGADINRGRDLFVANCSACHGPAGGGGAVGGGFVAPALTDADPTQVGEAVITGPGPMPRFSFPPQDLNDLAAYALYLRDAPHPGGATTPAVGPVTEGFIAGMTLLGLLLVARWVAVRRERAA